MNTLESKIEAILERNKRVEAEKAWEQSFTRRLFLFLVTYITAMLIFWSLEAPLPALQAIVPSLAFILSTLSLPWIRKRWMRRRARRNRARRLTVNMISY
ncbi:MAG: hypothetical protein AAB489_00165 [Patescibacteria group bacterium]